MSWLSSLFKSNKGSSDSQSGALMPSVYLMPQYDFTEPRLKETSSFISDNIARMREGKYPDYYENALPSMRENLSRSNYDTYYGTPGRQGILRSQMDVGAITGLGPKKTSSLVDKSLYDYGVQEKQIDEYLTKMGVDIMQRDATAFPTLSMQMPKGPDAQVVYPQQVQGQTVDAAGGGGAFGSLLNGLLGSGGDLLGGITNLFGQSSNTGQAQASQSALSLGNLFGGSSGGTTSNGYANSMPIMSNSNSGSMWGYQQPTSAQGVESSGWGKTFGIFQ